jgi:hypothetical protein
MPRASTALRPRRTRSRSRGSARTARPPDRYHASEAVSSTPDGGGSQLPRRGDAVGPLRQSVEGERNTGSGPDAAGAAREDLHRNGAGGGPVSLWSGRC